MDYQREGFTDEPEADEIETPRSHPVSVWSGLKEHLASLGEALPLFLWLVMAETREVRRGEHWIGIVHGGKPLKDSYLAAELEVCEKTISRWRARLVDRDYIEATRTGYGYKYTVLRAKRWRHAWPADYLRWMAENSQDRAHAEARRMGRGERGVEQVRQPRARPGAPARARTA